MTGVATPSILRHRLHERAASREADHRRARSNASPATASRSSASRRSPTGRRSTRSFDVLVRGSPASTCRSGCRGRSSRRSAGRGPGVHRSRTTRRSIARRSATCSPRTATRGRPGSKFAHRATDAPGRVEHVDEVGQPAGRVDAARRRAAADRGRRVDPGTRRRSATRRRVARRARGVSRLSRAIDHAGVVQVGHARAADRGATHGARGDRRRDRARPASAVDRRVASTPSDATRCSTTAAATVSTRCCARSRPRGDGSGTPTAIRATGCPTTSIRSKAGSSACSPRGVVA